MFIFLKIQMILEVYLAFLANIPKEQLFVLLLSFFNILTMKLGKRFYDVKTDVMRVRERVGRAECR